MSGGGGTNTTTQSSAPPKEFLDAYSRVNAQAQNVASVPYAPYPGQTVAGLSPDQLGAMDTIRNSSGIAAPYINAAAGHLDAATAPIWNDPNVQHFSPEAVSQYESPYTNDVVNATAADFNNQNDISNQRVVGDAISRGAWGGDRSAVAQAINEGQNTRTQAPVLAGLRDKGYSQALQQFNTQQGAQLGATQAQRWLDSQAASGFGALGQEALGTTLTGAQAQLGIGGLEQTQAQAELNVPYQQYLAAQGYPFQTTGWLANIAQGLGGASGGTGTSTSPGPSVASQYGGLATAGVGLAGQMGAFDSWGGGSGWNAGGSAGGGGGIEGFTAGASGGAIPHRAGGGSLGLADIPDLSVSVIPGSTGLGAAPASHGQSNILKNYGQTSTSTQENADSDFGSLLKTAGMIATAIYAPYALPAASAFNSSVHFGRGGGIGPMRRDGGGNIPSVTLQDSAHGGIAVPQLNFTGDAPGGAGGGIAPSVSDYFASQRAGQSFAPPPMYVPPPAPVAPAGGMNGVPEIGPSGWPIYDPDHPVFPSESRETGAVYGNNAGSSADNGWRGGAIGREDGGFIPSEAPDPNGSVWTPDPEEPEEAADILGFTGTGPSIPGGGLTAEGEPKVSAAGDGPSNKVPITHAVGYIPPPEKYAPLVQAAAEKHGVDPKQLAWLISRESGWNPKAYNPASGTMGLGQFKAATAREVGIDPWDPAQAIDGSAAYLRKMLNKTGGDYERAIGRYGTFSTWQGAGADSAVRRQYHQFMGAARGDGIMARADGGDLPYGPDLPESFDGEAAAPPYGPDLPEPFDTDDGPLPVRPIPPRDGGIAVNSGASDLPSPPPSPTESPGIAAEDGASDGSTRSKIPWNTIMNVGLGIMSGTSPHALTNVGRGALTGIQMADKQKAATETAALKREQQKYLAMERKARAALTEAKTANEPIKSLQADRKLDIAEGLGNRKLDQSGPLNAARAEYLQWKSGPGAAASLAMQQAKLDEIARHHGVTEGQGQATIDQRGFIAGQTDVTRNRAIDAQADRSATPTYTYQPGLGPDPANPEKQVSGVYKMPNRGDEQPQFIPGVALTQRGVPSTSQMPEDVKRALAEQLVTGDTSALSGLGAGNVGSQNRIAVQEEATRIRKERGMTGSDQAAATAGYMGERAGARTAGTREANVNMAVIEAQKFMPLAIGASNKVDRTQFPTINSIIQAYEKGTGDENIVRLAVATNSLTNAYSRAITPSGIPTEGNQTRARELLDRAWSKGQYAAAVDQLWQEMQAAKASPEQAREEQRSRISGRPAPGDTNAGSSPSSPWKYNAAGPGGMMLHSNDGKTWLKPDGSPYAP